MLLQRDGERAAPGGRSPVEATSLRRGTIGFIVSISMTYIIAFMLSSI